MTNPSFREIADVLRKEIWEGIPAFGDKLPTEPALAARFGVSRALTNRAVQVLSAEGLVRARQGDGTRVTYLEPFVQSSTRYQADHRERDGARGSFDAEIRARGLEPRHEITTERVAAPGDIADLMRLPPGEVNTVLRSRLLLASGIPIRMNASWLPLDIAADTALEEPSPTIVGGIKSLLAELGHRQVEATETVLNRLPTPDETAVLDISPERTVYDIVHVGRTTQGRVVEVTRTVAPAHYLVLENTIPLA